MAVETSVINEQATSGGKRRKSRLAKKQVEFD